MATTLAIHSALGVIPPTANPGFMVLRNQHPLYSMSQTDIAVFTGKMPQAYSGGDIDVIINGVMTSATTGNLNFDIEFEKIAAAGQDIDSSGFGNVNNIADTAVSGNAGVIQSLTKTVTNANADLIAAGDDYRLRITRKTATASAAAGDFELKSVELRQA